GHRGLSSINQNLYTARTPERNIPVGIDIKRGYILQQITGRSPHTYQTLRNIKYFFINSQTHLGHSSFYDHFFNQGSVIHHGYLCEFYWLLVCHAYIFNKNVFFPNISDPNCICSEINIRKHEFPLDVTLCSLDITLVRLLEKGSTRTYNRIVCFFINNNGLYRTLLRKKK